MPGPKLTREQRDEIIAMLAAREPYQAIADKVGCSWENISYHARKHAALIAERQKARDAALADRGLRSVEKRVEELHNLAALIRAELTQEAADKRGSIGPLWLKDYRIGKSFVQDVDVFAGGIISEYRAVLNDIAKELGHRIVTTKTELTGKDGEPLKTYVTISPDDWDEVTKPGAEQSSSNDNG